MIAAPPASGDRPASGPSVASPLLLSLAVVALGQAYLAASPALGDLAGAILSLLVPLGAFGLFTLWLSLGRRRWVDHGFVWPVRGGWTAGVAALALTAYIVVVLEPGLGFGFQGSSAPTLWTIAYWLAYAPLVALSAEAVFRGALLKGWVRPGRLAGALTVSSALFAVTVTNVPALLSLPGAEVARYLLTTSVPAFTLGLVLGVYFVRAGSELLGPFLLRTGVLLFTGLVPFSALAPDWVTVFLIQLGALGVSLAIVWIVVVPSRAVRRRYFGESLGPRRDRFLAAMRWPARRRAAWATLAAVASVGAVAVVGLPWALGTPRPVLAIASGSMAPSLERGSLVVIEHQGPAEISVGTVVAYDSAQLPSPVIHRVVGVSAGPSGPVYTTRGDANPAADPFPVPYASVLGAVVLSVPFAGYLLLSPALPLGLVVLALTVSLTLNAGASARFPRSRRGGR